jgi:hypothetical protein
MLTPQQKAVLRNAADLPAKQRFPPFRTQLGHASAVDALLRRGLLERVHPQGSQYRLSAAGEAAASNDSAHSRAGQGNEGATA